MRIFISYPFGYPIDIIPDTVFSGNVVELPEKNQTTVYVARDFDDTDNTDNT